MEPWQTWCMRGTENPENVVRVHGVPQNASLAQLVEYLICNQVVVGSSPAGGSEDCPLV